MSDYIVRAIGRGGFFRAFAITSKEMVEEARERHNTSPIMTAALGRLLTGASMMGVMMKNEDDLLTIQIRSEGPARGLTVTADANGNVKGYPIVPDVMLPPNEKGKLDVGGAIGPGVMNVIKDLGLKEPYAGQIELQTGEIAEDLTYYFATSEQVPSAVGLGVLMNKDNTVRCAGGFIIQLMPYTPDEYIDELEERLSKIAPVTTMLDAGLTPEAMLEVLIGDMELEFVDKIDTQFKCNCSHDKVEQALISIGAEEIEKMISEEKPVEVKCDFCNTAYEFNVEELKAVLEKIRNK